jgi:carboxymethylenebutenolidase
MTSSGAPARAAGLDVYLARPERESRAGVLLLPAANGIAPGLRRCAADLAEAGLVALAWDPFRGRDVSGLGFPELMPLLGAIQDADALAEQRALLDHMTGELGVERVGVIGWCFGGRLALVLAARERRLAACVAYHPSIRGELRPNQTEDAFALAAGIACPVQWVHPGADQVITPDVFPVLRDALMGRATGSTDLQFHPGAEHGFMERQTTDANRRATRLAWPQTIAFLRATLAGDAGTGAARAG